MDDLLADVLLPPRDQVLRVAGWQVRIDGTLPGRPVDACVRQVREGLDGLLVWLRTVAADEQATPDASVIASVVAALGQVDAQLLAALSRSVVLSEEAGCADADGQASPTDWLAGQLRLTRSGAGRLARLAADLDGLPDVLAALEAAEISRDHAVELADADARRRRDAEAAARAAHAAAKAEAEAMAKAAEQAARDAEDAAEADRIRRAADDLARRQREEAARQAAAAKAAAEARRREEQEDLLRRARDGAAPDDVAQTAERQRAADRDAQQRSEAAQWAIRWTRTWTDKTTGQGRGAWALPADEQEILLAMLDSLRTFDDPMAEPDERRSFEQRQADAFIDLIRSAAAAGTAPTSRGQKPHLTVTVPGAAMTGESDEPGRARHGSLLSPSAVRRWLCDAAVSLAVLSATSQVLDIGRQTRTWTAAQHRAAEIAFGGCGFPIAPGRMCGRPIGWTELHHAQWWRNGGRTDQANGVPLCVRHHRAVHHDGWMLDYDFDAQQISVTRHGSDGSTIHRAVDLRRPCSAPTDPPDPDEVPADDGRLPL
jgi:hypothetical protein